MMHETERNLISFFLKKKPTILTWRVNVTCQSTTPFRNLQNNLLKVFINFDFGSKNSVEYIE